MIACDIRSKYMCIAKHINCLFINRNTRTKNKNKNNTHTLSLSSLRQVKNHKPYY